MVKRKKVLTLIISIFLILIFEVPVYAAEIDIIQSISAKVYKNQSTDSDILANLVVGNVFEVIDAQNDESGIVWYHIVTDFGAEGYVQEAEMDNLLQAISAYQHINQTNTQETEIPDNENTEETQSGKIITLNSVNLRKEPSTDANIISQIGKSISLEYLDIVENEYGEKWYKVLYDGKEGYVSESTVTMADESLNTEIESDIENSIETLEQTESETEMLSETDMTVNESYEYQELEFEEIEKNSATDNKQHTTFEVKEKTDKTVIADFLLPIIVIDGVICIAAIVLFIKRILKLLRK